MLRALLACVVLLAGAAAPSSAQSGGEGVGALLARIERVFPLGDPAALRPLLSPNVAPGVMDTFAPQVLTAPARRVVVHERDRDPLDGALPGDGFRLTVDIFLESARSARIVTARLDVRRAPSDTAPDAWRIISAQAATVVEGLHRLVLSETTQFSVRDLAVRSEDLLIQFSQGTAVPVESRAGFTGFVIVGSGHVTFSPKPQAERDQVRLFSGAEALAAPLKAVFVRFNPSDGATRELLASLTAQPHDARMTKRARDLFEDDAPRSFSLDLGDLSRDIWYVIPPPGDLLAELHTRGHGHLTYARSFNEAEDVSFFERARGRDIARYASAEKLERRGLHYNEDDLADIQVLDYDIDATVDPAREFIDARARLKIKVQAAGAATISLHLAESLVVTSASSPELGRILHLRVRGRESVVLNLPVML